MSKGAFTKLFNSKGAFLLFSILACTHLNGEYNNWQWTIGLCVAALLFCVQSIESFYALAAFYFVAQGLLTALTNVYSNSHLLLIMAPLMATACFVGAICTGLFFREIDVRAFGLFGFFNSLLVLVQYRFGWEFYTGRQSGFIDYASLNGALIALSVPFVLEELEGIKSLPPLLFMGAAMWVSHSTTPWVVLAVVVAAYAWAKCRSVAFAGIAVAVPALASCIDGIHYNSGSGRLDAYKVFLGYWANHFNTIIGSGAGTFRVLSHDIQTKTGFGLRGAGETLNLEYWPWLHSDWLQILFEFGIIGLGIASCLFAVSLIKLYRRGDASTFSMLLGLGVTGIANYPLRYFIFGVFGTIALARALQPRRD